MTFSIRALTRGDLPTAVELWAGAFGAELPDEAARTSTAERLAFALESDPGGSFAAERNGELIGLAQALRREQLWVLASLAVSPLNQGRGAGAVLLERAFAFGNRALCRLVVSSNDPRALTLYERLGLTLRPTVQGEGQVKRSALELPSRTFAEGGPRDVDGLAELSRAIRGAPHTREILYALRSGGTLLLGERGFSVVRPGSGVWLLVAEEEREARELLSCSLRLVGECDRPPVRWVTDDQRWAIEVLEAAGLTVRPYGALCVGGTPGTLKPFIPSGSFA